MPRHTQAATVFCLCLSALFTYRLLREYSTRSYELGVKKAGGGQDEIRTDTLNAAAVSDVCTTSNRRIIRSVTVPISEFDFKFNNDGTKERTIFVTTIYCGVRVSYRDYANRALAEPQKSEDGTLIYDMGTGEDLRFKPQGTENYYFCFPRHEPDNDKGRTCHADYSLGFGWSADTGMGLMINYGIDYDNRSHVTEINSALVRYFTRIYNAVKRQSN